MWSTFLSNGLVPSVNIDISNGLLPDSTKDLSDEILT